MIDLDMSDEIVNEKARLRKLKRRARASFSGEKRAAADEAIYNNFMASGFMEKYESFFVYNSVNTEADTKRLIKALVSGGKKVYLPRVIGKQLEAVPLGDKFIKSPFGIEEPVGKAYNGNIDIAIIPAFAFDLYGKRVGYGGGYYDRYLAAHKGIYKVVYGYDFQLARNIPAASFDISADYILTDKRSAPSKKVDVSNFFRDLFSDLEGPDGEAPDEESLKKLQDILKKTLMNEDNNDETEGN